MWPLVLALALRVPEPTGWFAASCRRLGWLSYPLYATHMPINEAMQPLMRSWGWPGTALCWVVVLAVAYAAARATEPTPRSSARLLHDQVPPRSTLLPIRK
jgi:peptidoglycan/LPS O-acetylase OafA/YrhL